MEIALNKKKETVKEEQETVKNISERIFLLITEARRLLHEYLNAIKEDEKSDQMARKGTESKQNSTEQETKAQEKGDEEISFLEISRIVSIIYSAVKIVKKNPFFIDPSSSHQPLRNEHHHKIAELYQLSNKKQQSNTISTSYGKNKKILKYPSENMITLTALILWHMNMTSSIQNFEAVELSLINLVESCKNSFRQKEYVKNEYSIKQLVTDFLRLNCLRSPIHPVFTKFRNQRTDRAKVSYRHP